MLVTGRSPVNTLIALLLLAAAALDLTRCGIVVGTAAHPAPAAGLVAAGLTAAALSLRTARGCRGGRRRAGWAALLIGVLSAPQAAASGFSPPYTFPDLATAAVGIVLAVILLATAGRPGQSATAAGNAYLICQTPSSRPGVSRAAEACPAGRPSSARRGRSRGHSRPSPGSIRLRRGRCCRS
jgi:hypothetical protein